MQSINDVQKKRSENGVISNKRQKSEAPDIKLFCRLIVAKSLRFLKFPWEQECPPHQEERTRNKAGIRSDTNSHTELLAFIPLAN